MTSYFEIQIIAVIIALGCSIPGCLLMLRGMSMMADSITHTILLGIVLGFLVTGDLNSPLLLIGAGLIGVFTVWLTEVIQNTKLVSADASVGLIYPFLFSIAIILISKYSSKIHLDTDSVMLGELAFAPFNRLIIGGLDMGPISIYTCGTVLILNVLLTLVFYKEIKISIFDPVLAVAMGFTPLLIHYGVMTMVSITAVAAFDSIGSILVVALMIGPANGAYLISKDLKTMLLYSAIIGVVSSLIGVQMAFYYDVSIAGTIAVVIGIIFLLIFIFAKNEGLVSGIIKNRKMIKSIKEYKNNNRI